MRAKTRVSALFRPLSADISGLACDILPTPYVGTLLIFSKPGSG
jgi:hypothetical protein